MANLLDNITAYRESKFRDYDRNGRPLTSPKGARFAMQVMPDTARDPGFGLRPANPNDPSDMNRLGREYRAKMEQRYGGDHAKMWAAYNWGPGNLDRALSRHGENWLASAPAETRDYVDKNMRMYRNNIGGQPQSNPIMQALSNPDPFGGLNSAQLGQQMVEQMPTQINVDGPRLAEKKPGAFGKGGKGWAILGILGDSLQGYAGRPGTFAQSMMQMNEQEAEDRRFQQRLSAESAARAEALRMKAAEPTELMQRIRDLNEMQQGLGDTYAKNYANNGGGSMIQFVDPTTGQRMALPQPQLPTAPVGTLTPL